jgi:hypothetical protein
MTTKTTPSTSGARATTAVCLMVLALHLHTIDFTHIQSWELAVNAAFAALLVALAAGAQWQIYQARRAQRLLSRATIWVQSGSIAPLNCSPEARGNEQHL